MTRSTLLLVCLGLACAANFTSWPARAQIPALLLVPADVREPVRRSLIAQYSALEARKRTLQSALETFNTECAVVERGTAAYADCAGRHVLLQSRRQQYVSDADRFNEQVRALAAQSESPGKPPQTYNECTKWCREQFLPDVDKVQSCIAANCRQKPEVAPPKRTPAVTPPPVAPPKKTPAVTPPPVAPPNKMPAVTPPPTAVPHL